MKLRVAAILVSVAFASVHVACFDKPDAPQLPADGPRPGSQDAGKGTDADHVSIDATGPQGCPVVASFDGNGQACPSDFFQTNGGATIGFNGTLNFMLPALMGQSGACKGMTSFAFSGGASVTVTSMPGPGGNLWFTLFMANQSVRVTISSQMVSVTCPVTGGASMQVPLLPPFTIKMKGNGATNETITVSVTTGGGSMTLANCGITGLAGLATAELGATSGSGASISTASFDDLEACP